MHFHVGREDGPVRERQDPDVLHMAFLCDVKDKWVNDLQLVTSYFNSYWQERQ